MFILYGNKICTTVAICSMPIAYTKLVESPLGFSMSPLAYIVPQYVSKIQRPEVENEWHIKKPKDGTRK